MVPGWSGSVPVQFIFFNSYILNAFLYDKKLAWTLSFILNMIYEIFNTINTKTLVPSLLIWSRVNYWEQKPMTLTNYAMSYKYDMFEIENKSITGQYQFLCDRKLRITWHRQNRKIWSRIPIPRHGPIFHLHIINMVDEEKYLYAFRWRVYNLHLIQISARYMHVW